MMKLNYLKLGVHMVSYIPLKNVNTPWHWCKFAVVPWCILAHS